MIVGKIKAPEQAQVDHITRFMLELGKGFAFVDKQYHLEVGRVISISICCSITSNCTVMWPLS